MDNAKQKLLEFKGLVDYVEATRDVKVLQKCLNLVITGNPGTGKTTVAVTFTDDGFGFRRSRGTPEVQQIAMSYKIYIFFYT